MMIETYGDPRALPPFDAIGPEAILPALEGAIANHAAVVAHLISTRPATFAEVWLPLEAADNRLVAVWSAASHLHAVANSPGLRAAYGTLQSRLTDYRTHVEQNRELFDVLRGLTVSCEFARLPDADRVAVERAIRGATLSGVALKESDQKSFRAVSVELSELSAAFEAAVLDATDAWSEHLTDPGMLKGLSQADVEMFADAARTKGLPGWLVTLQMPSVAAILTFAEDRFLRRRVYEAFGTRASDQGPDADRFDNSGRITRILELRRQAARLLGFPDPVAWSLATKMANDPAEVLAFLRNLAARAKPVAQAEWKELTTFAEVSFGIAHLEAWDVAFIADRLRRERFELDEQMVRAYFPIDRVLSGWRSLLSRLFGIRLVQRHDVALWHDDVRFYDVLDASDIVIAGLYVDLHARAGKRSGAWMSQARPRLADGTVPVAHMVCNFAPMGGSIPSLLGHRDVVTLLHETGHCLHHLFTRVERPSIAGTAGFEWDAIELPSQLMEDFAWDRNVLTGMSGHYESGEPLPVELYGQMLAARRFQAGMFIVRQVEFGLFDLLLHLGTMGSNPMELIEAVRDEVAVVRPPAWHRFPHSFNHVFAGSYASGYYSYLWADVLAADAFSAFAEAGMLDRVTGDRLRDEILARGATRPASTSFRAFRGRDPDPQAMLVRHGLVEAAS